MRKTLITCDHCHKEIKVAGGADGWLDINATVTVPGRPTETIGPVDLCRSCFHDTMRNAGFAFTAAPSPALPNGRGVGGSGVGQGVVQGIVARAGDGGQVTGTARTDAFAAQQKIAEAGIGVSPGYTPRYAFAPEEHGGGGNLTFAPVESSKTVWVDAKGGVK
jgi:hypothetical protein